MVCRQKKRKGILLVVSSCLVDWKRRHPYVVTYSSLSVGVILEGSWVAYIPVSTSTHSEIWSDMPSGGEVANDKRRFMVQLIGVNDTNTREDNCTETSLITCATNFRCYTTTLNQRRNEAQAMFATLRCANDTITDAGNDDSQPS